LTGHSPENPVHPRGSLLILILILLTLNLSIFLPSMKGGFLWDDKYFISENPNILSRGFLKHFLFSPFGGAEGFDENSPKAGQNRQFYRPLTSFSYWLDFKAWGLNPAGFHLTNILLHVVNSILFLWLLLRLGFAWPASFSGALLFSVFPVHFENVSWISGRTDLLSFLFAGLSLLYFLWFLEKKGIFRLAVSSLFYLAALLSKENVVFLPVLIFLLLYVKRRRAKDIFCSLPPFGFAFLSWAVLRFTAFGSSEFHYSGRTFFDFLGTLGFYSWKLIYPFGLSLTIDPLPAFGGAAYRVFGLGLLILLAASIFFIIKKGKGLARGFFPVPVYFIFLLPSAAVIFSAATLSLAAWRFLYLPSAVLAAAVAYGLFVGIKRRAFSVAILVLLLAVFAVEILPKNRLYGRDDTNFWLGINDFRREDLIAKFNAGIKYLPVDEGKALGLFDDIIGEKDHPLYEFWKTRVDEELAIYFAFQKDFPKAEHYFQELRKAPAGLSLHATFNYAYYLAFSGRTKEGESIIGEKLRAHPRNHFVLTRSAKFYLLTKDYDKAEELYARDYAIFPTQQTRKLLDELRELRQKTDKG
jgi:tetratricopeptide (TPR) repeat protein